MNSRPIPRVQRRRRRALAALALAVAMASPIVGARIGFAADRPNDAGSAAAHGSSMFALLQDQPASNDDLLKRGGDQLNNKQYEEAVTTLQQVNADQLDAAGKRRLNEMLSQAQDAANQRKAARAAFTRGEDALTAGDPAKAINEYRAAANNNYADDGTRAKAREQLAVAEAQAKQAGVAVPAEAPAAGAGAAGAAGAGAAGAAAAQPTAQPQAMEQPSAQPESQPQAAPLTKSEVNHAYQLGRDQYRKGDWINARKNLELARDNGYKPGLFEDSPGKILSRMDSKEQADARKSAQQMAAQQDRERQEAEAQAREAARTAPVQEPPSNQMTNATGAGAAGAGAGAGTAVAANAQTAPTTAEPAPTTHSELQQSAELARVSQAQNTRQSQQLVAQAREAQNSGAADANERALQLYESAVAADPNNQEAVAGRNELLTLMGRNTPGTIMERQAREIEARRQALRYEIDSNLQQANTNIARNDYDAARRNVQAARVARNSDPAIFTPGEVSSFDANIEKANVTLDQAQAAFNAQQEAQRTADAARALHFQDIQRHEETQRTVKALADQARRLTNQGKFEEALGVVDQILVVDPGNDYAIGVRPLIEDRALLQEQRRYREDFDRQMTRQFNAADEKKIPYMDILRYPENWPDLSATRDQTVASERGEIREDAAVQAQLDRTLPEVRLDGSPFTDVVDFLRDVTSSNIFVNWRALETAGIAKDAPVTARLRNVKFSKALQTILEDVGGGNVKLGYTIDDGVITISTEDDLNKNVVTRVYDIRDLIINIPDFDQAPDFNISQQNSGGRGGGGGGQSLFGGGGSTQEENRGPTRTELVDSIVKLIQDTVASDTWKDNGGVVGSVRELSGQLIVTQTPENQRNLVKLLEQLRETRAIQVTIETRFLKIQRNFLEDIGVDFDFQFNGLDSRIIGNNITGGLKRGAIGFNQGSAEFTSTLGLDTTLPGNLSTQLSGGPGIVTSVAFIDDFQVSALIRATQAQQASTTITAPRVTLFNGQRAYVLVATSRAYVSDLNPVVGSNAVGFDPTISTVQSGVLLDVQATVSSDRKYVTLTLRPQLSNLLQLVPFSIGGTTIIPSDSAATQPFSSTGVIQQPEVQITEVRTTVSVPDGGTLLLGGQTLSGEIEREMGVPVLSKIPFLKRLFTNRSMAKDDQVLLILVKPTIIIQREQEQRQFPLMNTKAGT